MIGFGRLLLTAAAIALTIPEHAAGVAVGSAWDGGTSLGACCEMNSTTGALLDCDACSTTTTYLDLKTVGITSLPEDVFAHLKDLDMLNLRDNFIVSLGSSQFRNLTNLTWLSFSGNQITSLPSAIFQGPSRLREM